MLKKIKMPFWLWTWVGPRNCVLDGGPDPLMGRENFGENGLPIIKYRDTVLSCAKTAEPIEMSFDVDLDWPR